MADDVTTLIIKADSTDIKRAEKDLDSLSKTSKTVEGNVTKMASAFSNSLKGAVAGLGFGVIAKDILDTNRQMEMLRASLTSVTGSIESGKDAFKRVQEFATSTPFEVADLTKAFISLQNFGIQPTNKVMEAITNQASKLGASTETLNGITLALGQAWAKGKLQGEEILQLVERGVPVWDLLAQATGKSTSELQKMSEKGLLTRDVISKLIEKMGELSSGSNARAMETLGGQISNLSDAWHQFEDTLLNDKGEGYIKSFVKSVTNEISVLTRYLSSDVNSQIKVLEDRIKNYQSSGSVMRAIGDYTGYDVNVDKERLAKLKQQQELETQAAKEREVEQTRTADLKRNSDERAKAAADEADKREKAAKKLIEINKDIEKSFKDFNEEMNLYVFDSTQSLVSDVEQYKEKLAKDTQRTSENLADAIAAYNDKIRKEQEDNSDKMSKYAERAAENMQDAFANFLFDPFAKGTTSMGEQFAIMLRRMAAQAAASKIFDLLTPMVNAGLSSAWGGLKGLFSTAGTASAASTGVPALGNADLVGPASSFSGSFFATGGDHAGGLRVVGENGPELEATGASRIFNAQQTKDILSGGGNTNNIVVNVTNDGKQSADMMGDQIAKSIIRTIAREEIANATRPGNQLNKSRF